MSTAVNAPFNVSSTPQQQRSRSIGAILVEQGRLSAAHVEEIQRYASTRGLRFGDAALQLKLLSQEDIDAAVAQQYNYPILARGGEGGVSDEVVAAYQPQSSLLEPLRALRSQLILRWLNVSNRRVLVITSPARGEGRSWLAANLAVMFAQLGERTLLIDADMRHPCQHHLFNINNAVGLSALLTGRAGREIAYRVHPQLRLFVVPAGVSPPNPQELLERPIFELVLNLFAEQFSVVVLDSPASTESADAQILAARAGNALVVAHRDHSRQAQLLQSMRNLSETGVNVVGTVLTEY